MLEHGYLTRVERAHHLPPAERQLSVAAGRPMFRDVEYADHGVIVELDGRLGHSSTGDRDRDMDRDLDAAVGGRTTLRLSYGQVFDRPCLTAARVAAVLGVPFRPCTQCGTSDSPGESEFPRSA